MVSPGPRGSPNPVSTQGRQREGKAGLFCVTLIPGVPGRVGPGPGAVKVQQAHSARGIPSGLTLGGDGVLGARRRGSLCAVAAGVL